MQDEAKLRVRVSARPLTCARERFGVSSVLKSNSLVKDLYKGQTRVIRPYRDRQLPGHQLIERNILMAITKPDCVNWLLRL